jgi:K+-sensing histidine kinase KdpD
LHSLSRYGLAIALVSTALFLSLVLRVPFGNPFCFFFPVAVIASTWFGGRGPGWVAVGLSTLAVLYYFIPPVNSFVVKPPDVPFFLTFVACEAVANWLISWQRQTEDSLRRARPQFHHSFIRVMPSYSTHRLLSPALRAGIESRGDRTHRNLLK